MGLRWRHPSPALPDRRRCRRHRPPPADGFARNGRNPLRRSHAKWLFPRIVVAAVVAVAAVGVVCDCFDEWHFIEEISKGFDRISWRFSRFLPFNGQFQINAIKSSKLIRWTEISIPTNKQIEGGKGLFPQHSYLFTDFISICSSRHWINKSDSVSFHFPLAEWRHTKWRPPHKASPVTAATSSSLLDSHIYMYIYIYIFIYNSFPSFYFVPYTSPLAAVLPPTPLTIESDSLLLRRHCGSVVFASATSHSHIEKLAMFFFSFLSFFLSFFLSSWNKFVFVHTSTYSYIYICVFVCRNGSFILVDSAQLRCAPSCELGSMQQLSRIWFLHGVCSISP